MPYMGMFARLGCLTFLLGALAASGQELVVDPLALHFQFSPIAGRPSDQSIFVSSRGVGELTFTVDVETQNNIPWLSVTGPSAVTPTTLTVGMNPITLDPGTYLGSIKIASAGATNSPVLVAVQLSVLTGGRAMSQIADGGGWMTTLILVNQDPQVAPFTVRFLDSSGQPLVLPIEGRGSLDRLDGIIPSGGSRTYRTAGQAAAVSQGWCELAAPLRMGGLAIFRQQLPGLPAMEAASPVTITGLRLLLPFDNVDGFVTSMALVNAASTEFASVATVLRDESGNQLGRGNIDLPPRGHTAFRLLDRFPVVAGKRGVAEFSTTRELITGLGIRFNPLGAFTSFPLLSPPPPGGIRVGSQFLPQIADGNGWKTTITLLNTDVEAASLQIRFWQGDGTPMTVPFEGLPAGSTLQESLAAGRLGVYRILGTAAQTTQGWVEINTPGSVDGFAVFRQRVTGRLDFEAGVPTSPPAARFAIPFDNTQGYVTSMAMVNPSASQFLSVTVTLRNEDGAVFGSETLIVQPRTHSAFALSDRWPATAGRRGVAEFFSTGQGVSALGLRFSPSGAFTSFPVIRR